MVKLVYNNHSMNQVMLVSVDRWSLHRGALLSLEWPKEQPAVVSIDRWSFCTSGLWDVFHCTCFLEECAFLYYLKAVDGNITCYVYVCVLIWIKSERVSVGEVIRMVCVQSSSAYTLHLWSLCLLLAHHHSIQWKLVVKNSLMQQYSRILPTLVGGGRVKPAKFMAKHL